MSADNGIYIAKFPDGYRFTEAMAIENIDYYPEGSKERKQELKNYFGDSFLFENEKRCLEEAYLYSKSCYTEYGIVYLGEYESFVDE